MKILVTGGTGYIGSHTCVELLNKGYEVVVFDNLYNSKIDVVDKIEKITGKKITFYKADMLDKESMRPIFEEHKLDAVIHFAGLKAVGESVAKPLMYYQNNITGTLNLCELMKEYGCKRIIFSSSATVYGDPAQIPITEACPKGTCTNPYGWTKSMLEQILSDFYTSDNEWSVVLLRYFNPIGAHESGLLGESPNGIPNNLMPYIMQVAVGKLPELGVFGDDYDTPFSLPVPSLPVPMPLLFLPRAGTEGHGPVHHPAKAQQPSAFLRCESHPSHGNSDHHYIHRKELLPVKNCVNPKGLPLLQRLPPLRSPYRLRGTIEKMH